MGSAPSSYSPAPTDEGKKISTTNFILSPVCEICRQTGIYYNGQYHTFGDTILCTFHLNRHNLFNDM